MGYLPVLMCRLRLLQFLRSKALLESGHKKEASVWLLAKGQIKMFFESYRYDSKGIYLTQRNFMDLRSATGQESGQAVRQASGDIALRSGTEAFEYDSYGRLVRF